MAHENLVRAVLSDPATWTFNKAAAPFRMPATEGVVLLVDSEQQLQKAEYVAYTGITDNGASFALTGVTRAQEGSAQEAWTAGAILLQTSLASLMNKLDGLNASVIPAPDKLPRANAQGKLDSNWLTYELPAILEAKGITGIVDICVYNTALDTGSDAWRYNRKASWYNEPLNTATRGARREFPAVAVIVAESTKVTIYDGDDPSLPMWRVPLTGLSGLTSVSAINGQIYVGRSNGADRHLYFIEDRAKQRWNDAPLNGYVAENLANYFGSGTLIGGDADVLVGGTTNDVAMTVLPNAPVDPATDLQIPTIAVATDGGVSVIKDDRPVVDITSTGPESDASKVEKVYFNDAYEIVFSHASSWEAQYCRLIVMEIPDADISGYNFSIEGARKYKPVKDGLSPSGGLLPTLGTLPQYGDIYVGAAYNGKIAIDCGRHLAVLNEKPDTPENGMVAHINSSYNTGWMHANCKLAALCDTETGSISAPERVTNGTFDTSLSGWGVGSGWSWEAGTAKNSSSYAGYLIQSPFTKVGALYKVVFENVGVSGGAVYINTGGGYVTQLGVLPSSGTFSFYHKCLSATDVLAFAGAAGYAVKNVSAKEVTPDRSGNNNHLNIVGTLDRQPIGDGEIAAWSGFGSYDFIETVEGAIGVGTEDFYLSAWIVHTGTGSQAVFSYGDESASGNRFWFGSSEGNIRLFSNLGSSSTVIPIPNEVPVKYELYRKNGDVFIYVNSKFKASVIMNGDLANALAKIRIGVSYNAASPFLGSIALPKFSFAVPTPDQIAKMYRDELAMIQGKATLYGSSDAVTAVAHDPVTGLLHVGTSDGRTVLDSIAPVDYTTDPVTAAISAVDGLVVEG